MTVSGTWRRNQAIARALPPSRLSGGSPWLHQEDSDEETNRPPDEERTPSATTPRHIEASMYEGLKDRGGGVVYEDSDGTDTNTHAVQESHSTPSNLGNPPNGMPRNAVWESYNIEQFETPPMGAHLSRRALTAGSNGWEENDPEGYNMQGRFNLHTQKGRVRRARVTPHTVPLFFAGNPAAADTHTPPKSPFTSPFRDFGASVRRFRSENLAENPGDWTADRRREVGARPSTTSSTWEI